MISGSELGSRVLVSSVVVAGGVGAGGVVAGGVVAGGVVAGGVVAGGVVAGGGVLGSVLSGSIVTGDLNPVSSKNIADGGVSSRNGCTSCWLSGLAVRLSVMRVRNRLKRGVLVLCFFDDDGEAVGEFNAERFRDIVVDILVVETENERLCNFEVKHRMLLAKIKSFAPY
jgi:hypothetical protein